MSAGVASASAFVLAGGQSTRMGTDKAFLDFHGQTLLHWALASARSVVADVRVVGLREKFASYAPVVEDVFPGHGPLGGIHAALTVTGTDLNLILAVDLPFATPALLKYLLDRATDSSATVTVARVGGRLHPLCAVYRRNFIARAEHALRIGKNKIDPLFQPGDTLVVEETELERLSFPATMFDNINTREEYERSQTTDDGSRQR